MIRRPEEAQKAGGKVFRYLINLGNGAAISSCLRSGVEAGADVLTTLNADLQHNPQDIPFLVKPILDGSANIVTDLVLLNKMKKMIYLVIGSLVSWF